MRPSRKSIDELRHVSRLLVRQLGMLGAAHSELGLTNSQVHTIVELANGRQLNLIALAKILNLEKSTVSRLVAQLLKRELIRFTSNEKDQRSKMLTLTSKGERLLQEVHQRARSRVAAALKTLDQNQIDQIICSIKLYADVLTLTNPEQH